MDTSFFGGSFNDGGFFSFPVSPGYDLPAPPRKSKKDIHAERIALGILREPKAIEAIQQVATTVIEAKAKPGLAFTESEQTALLEKLFTERGLIAKSYRDINASLIEAIAYEVREIELMAQQAEDEAIVALLFDWM